MFDQRARPNRPLQFHKRSQHFIGTHKLVYRPLQFQKGTQLFIGAHDETLSVAMRVNNPDRSAFNINC